MPDAVGLSFHETMAGGFSLGTADPETGRREGERAATALAMHATVTIADLDRFISDPDHTGRLAGTIDFGPWSMGIEATSGVFNMFSPGGAPNLKLVVYELALTKDGAPYYLAGRREVRSDPGFDVWRDTTILLTRLHQGTDASGPVVGAGVLSLGVTGLILLLRTMRAENAHTVAQKTEALARFSRLFLGALWDSYAPHLGR